MENCPTILIIEDENLLLNVISKKLKLSGLSAVSCTSGKQALDYLSSHSNLPDAIWLDYYLKDMNGLEFMTSIKANPNYKEIPVVVVTNSANPEKVKKMMDMGASKYFVKAEHRLDDIIKMVYDLVSNKKMKSNTAKKLLIVEDDQFTLNAYSVKLKSAGFEIKTALDGSEALEILNSYNPDLILMDLVMPKKDGFTFLSEIKKNDRLKNIPVIIASNLGQNEDITRGIKLGAVDYVVKPDLTLNELISKIKTILNIK